MSTFAGWLCFRLAPAGKAGFAKTPAG